MNALVLEGNEKLVYKSVPDPIIAPDECLISVKCAGVCSSDFPRAYKCGAYSYPLIMGHEFAGQVMSVGSAVKSFLPGDGVAVFPLLPCKTCEFCQTKQYQQCISYNYYGSRTNGGFSEFIAIKEWNLLKIPQGLSFERAAVIEPIAVAFHAISKVEIKLNEKIAILGAGFIGLVTALILSKLYGHKQICLIDLDENKLALAQSYGFKTICSKDNDSWAELFVKDGGAGVVFEICGAAQTFKQSLLIAKNNGTVVWVGNVSSDVTLDKKLISSVLRKELTIKGSWNSSFTHEATDDWHKAINFAKHTSELDQMITHEVSLAKGVSFFDSKMNADSQQSKPYIKAIFKF